MLASPIIAAIGDLEKQFRDDCANVVRLANPKKEPPKEFLSKTVDDLVGGIKILDPRILEESPKPRVPSDDELRKSFAALVQLLGDEPQGEFWGFYTPKWKAQQLNSTQKVIFGRLIRTMLEGESKHRKKG